MCNAKCAVLVVVQLQLYVYMFLFFHCSFSKVSEMISLSLLLLFFTAIEGMCVETELAKPRHA